MASNFRFGNRAMPGSGVVMPWLDLNDKITWYTKEFNPQPAALLDYAQQSWRGQSSRMGGDRGPLKLGIKAIFDESGAGRVLATDHAAISAAGEQWLQLSATTQVLAEYADFVPTIQRPGSGTKVYGVDLTLMARKGYAEDMTATAPAATPLSGSSTGAATNLNITYPGTILTRPVWTLTIPNTNTNTITQFKLQNTQSGETLTLNFSPALAASTAYTLTIDCENYTITSGTGTSYDPVGSFPKLYPPGGTVNTFVATLTTGAGTSTGVTLGVSYFSHWEVQA